MIPWISFYVFSKESTLQITHTFLNVEDQCTGLNKTVIIEENLNMPTERYKNPSAYTFVLTQKNTK